ncbi:hypothetical protein [Streptomyces sp. NPDC002133]|uniref:ATP-dependent DNA ligase n=1 Tax=Streptomyces sp. NPDC002133 TaxID=3154409 RepID=UPI00331C16D7
MSLAHPLEPMLAKPVPQLPGPGALPGGLAFEPKYDGFRLLVFAGADAFLQSRSGGDLTGAFPEIAAAAAALDENVVIDGEAVIYSGGRLDFGALQQRMGRRPRNVARLASEQPAHLVAFDLLQHADAEMLDWTYQERRAALESLFQGHDMHEVLRPQPVQLVRDAFQIHSSPHPSVRQGRVCSVSPGT